MNSRNLHLKNIKLLEKKFHSWKKICTYKAIKCSDQTYNIYILPKETPLTGWMVQILQGKVTGDYLVYTIFTTYRYTKLTFVIWRAQSTLCISWLSFLFALWISRSPRTIRLAPIHHRRESDSLNRTTPTKACRIMAEPWVDDVFEFWSNESLLTEHWAESLFYSNLILLQNLS